MQDWTDTEEGGRRSSVSMDSIKLYRIPLGDFSDEVISSNGSDDASCKEESKQDFDKEDQIGLEFENNLPGDLAQSNKAKLRKFLVGEDLRLQDVAAGRFVSPTFLMMWRSAIICLSLVSLIHCFSSISNPCCALAPIVSGALILASARMLHLSQLFSSVASLEDSNVAIYRYGHFFWYNSH